MAKGIAQCLSPLSPNQRQEVVKMLWGECKKVTTSTISLFGSKGKKTLEVDQTTISLKTKKFLGGEEEREVLHLDEDGDPVFNANNEILGMVIVTIFNQTREISEQLIIEYLEENLKEKTQRPSIATRTTQSSLSAFDNLEAVALGDDIEAAINELNRALTSKNPQAENYNKCAQKVLLLQQMLAAWGDGAKDPEVYSDCWTDKKNFTRDLNIIAQTLTDKHQIDFGAVVIEDKFKKEFLLKLRGADKFFTSSAGEVEIIDVDDFVEKPTIIDVDDFAPINPIGVVREALGNLENAQASKLTSEAIRSQAKR